MSAELLKQALEALETASRMNEACFDRLECPQLADELNAAEHQISTAIEALRAATPAQPTEVERDAARLDWLEAQINEHGAIHLHDGDHPNGHGLGLRPGALNRTLRQAIDAALSTEGGGNAE